MSNNVLQDVRGSPPPLRPYQEEALRLMKNYEGNAALVVIATGLGKTRVFTDFVRFEVTENNHHCLILSHRAELVYQPLEYLRDLPCGVELASKHAHGEVVISASVQSLVGRLDKYNPREIDTIIIDEAHHAAAPTYRKILTYFVGTTVFGFTATAHRGDGVALGCVFDDLIYERNTLWGVEHGYLTPIQCCQVNLKYDMGSVKIEDNGDFNQSDVARVMSGTAAGVVEAFSKHAQGQTIIFAASVDEAKDITALLNRKYGKQTAALITGATKNRDQILNAFDLGWIKVVVNFGVLTEGVDTRCAASIIIARPIAPTNVGLYAQMVGRGLRLYPGKSVCKVIDCVGISDNPICTAATLIGKDPPQPEPKKEPAEKDLAEPETIEVLTGEDVPATWIQTEKEVSVMDKGVGVDMHSVAWISLKEGGYILPIPNMIYRISKPLPDGTVFLYKNKKSSKAPMPQQFIFDFVYQDLQSKHPNMRHIWDKEQRRFWDKAKITPEQTALIHRLAPDYTINTATMTRGDASAIIQNLLYAKNKTETEAG